MTDPETLLPDATPAERAALEWFHCCGRGLSAAEEAEFERWLDADPEHARLFAEFDGTWALLGESRPAEAAARAPAHPGRRVAAALAAVATLAAALAVGYVSWWRPAHYSAETATAIGGLRTLDLPDGSRVTLNTGSLVTTAFSPEVRRVRLERGEAHFAVAKNPARPFVVDVAGVSVHAVGTAFNIRLDAKSVEVLVTEGRVRVDESVSGRSVTASPESPTADPILTSGRKLVIALPDAAQPIERPLVAAVAAVAPDEMQRQLAWQERRLDFVAVPLVEIAREFNRYNTRQLLIGDAELATRRFGGSFKSDDPAGFVRMLEENFGIVAAERGNQTVLRPR
ncbi:MAG TPA: FecR domain-containing protein [Lacunisphaera sp.]|jgi:transmembrane sensor|nr:FecR domain-containing protein [Lacunisphaera sp.]